MIIKDTPQFQLRATLVPYRTCFSLELHQHWPQAQRPESPSSTCPAPSSTPSPTS